MFETVESEIVAAGTETAGAGDRLSGALQFHRLVYLEDQLEVTVGRPDQGDYVVLSADVARLLRWLESGLTPAQAAIRYEVEFGEQIDVTDFIDSLDDLGFLRQPGEDTTAAVQIRWRRLASLVFSPVAAGCYLIVVATALWLVVRHPGLVPQPRNIFFGGSLLVFAACMLAGQLVMIMLHEASHALAGRRLGIASRLSIGRRFYFVVFETNLDGLVTVPRNKRILPIIAGMLCDIILAAALTIVAAALRDRQELPALSSYLLALVYLSCLRIAWQFWFFLETDIYYLISTVLGCLDLHAAGRQTLRNRFDRTCRRPPTFDLQALHPKDRAVARWFSILMAWGYLICGLVLVLGMIPVLARLGSVIGERVVSPEYRTVAGVLDAVLFVVLAFGEILFAAFLAIRQRRGRRLQSRLPKAA